MPKKVSCPVGRNLPLLRRFPPRGVLIDGECGLGWVGCFQFSSAREIQGQIQRQVEMGRLAGKRGKAHTHQGFLPFQSPRRHMDGRHPATLCRGRTSCRRALQIELLVRGGLHGFKRVSRDFALKKEVRVPGSTRRRHVTPALAT